MTNRPRTTELSRSADQLDGVTKAAILVLSLREDAARKLMSELPPEMVEAVTRAIARLGEVPADLAAQVIQEYYGMRIAGAPIREGGLEYARTLLRDSVAPESADRAMRELEAQVRKAPFAFLQRAESENLLTFIQDEHPQTIALIVSHLPSDKAAEILRALPEPRQVEVARRMATMDQTNPEVVRRVEQGLASRLSSVLTPSLEKVGGVETVADVLNLCDRGTEKTILEGIESDDPDLVEQIRRLMFVFEDVLLIDDRGIQTLLKEVDNDELCLALKTASDELKEKVFSNMSARASDLVREEMEYLGPVRLSDVEAAQQRLVDIVRRLEDAGEIIIAGRGGKGTRSYRKRSD